MGKEIFNLKSRETVRKKLRREATKAELLIWRKIRNKQLGCKFRRQHSIGKYVVDFICIERKLIIEIDGDVHFYDENIIKDKIVINFKDVSYIDSSGLATLVELLKGLRSYGGRLKLSNLSTKVKNLFEITKLEKLFDISLTEEEAIKSFKEIYREEIGEDIKKLIKKNTKVIFMESPGSLSFEMQDVPAICKQSNWKRCICFCEWSNSKNYLLWCEGENTICDSAEGKEIFVNPQLDDKFRDGYRNYLVIADLVDMKTSVVLSAKDNQITIKPSGKPAKIE